MSSRVGRAWRYIVALEPVRVVAVIRAVLVLAGAVGLAVSQELEGALVGLVVAVYALLEMTSTASARSRVVPVAKLNAPTVDAVTRGPLDGSPADRLAHPR